MNFIDSYDDLVSKLATNGSMLVLFVDPSVMTPSESLIKYMINSPIGKQLQANIFAYKGTEIKMFEIFNILSYPQVTVLKDKPNNVLYNFIGCNQEKAWQSLGVLAVSLGHRKPIRKLKVDHRVCPNNHQLKLVNQISTTNYKNGFFMCNQCTMLSHVQIDKPILHCRICQYDICNFCSYVESIN